MITSSKIILVEGKDEIEFLTALCNNESIDDFQFIEIGGIDRFKDEFPAILNDRNFDDVTSLAIIRDADKSQQAAVQSLQHYLKKYSLPTPSNHCEIKSIENLKVGIFVMPGNRDSGMLENLVLDSVADHPVKIEADRFIDQLKLKLSDKEFPLNEHKARLHAFLSGMRKFIPSIGIAAQKGYFNFDSVHFNELKIFLKSL